MIDRPGNRTSARSVAALVCILSSAALTTGCAQSTLTADKLLTTGSINPPKSTARPALTDEDRLQAGPRTTKQAAATSRAAAPRKTASTATDDIAQARKLRLAGQRLAALRLLDQAAARHPKNSDLMEQRGLLALEIGQLPKAEKLLNLAVKHNDRDWRLKSALGAAMAAQGQHKGAIKHLRAALRLSPGNPAILNNLALSYATAGNLKDAERILRRVVAKKARGGQLRRANQNLALVLGLRGKHAEARRVASSTLPAATASENVAYLRRLSSNVRVSRAPQADPRSGRFASLPGQRRP
jgi:Flp pilus assembly protein TadD